MKDSIFNLIKVVKNRIECDLLEEGLNTWPMVLCAYNEFQKNERMGMDYLFNLDNTGDRVDCLKSGLTAKNIAHLYHESMNNKTRFFFYHPDNHPTPEPITLENLRKLLIDELDVVLAAVIAYPWVDSYRKIYTEYICNYMINTFMV